MANKSLIMLLVLGHCVCRESEANKNPHQEATHKKEPIKQLLSMADKSESRYE